MDFSDKRKIEVNFWLLKARWIYIVGITSAGLLANAIGPYNFPMTGMVVIIIFAVISNYLFHFLLKDIKNNQSGRASKLKWLGAAQISLELLLFSAVFYYSGGLETVTAFFFVLPIVTSSVLLGSIGSLTTAFISSLLVSFIVGLEYSNIIPHIFPYGETNILEYSNYQVAATKILVVSLFYVVVGIYSGFSSKLLSAREYSLADKTNKLVSANRELDKKVDQLKRSEESIKKAYRDLKFERNKIKAIIANFADPIIVIDRRSRINLLNPSAVEALGFDEDDIGKTISSDNNYSMENFREILSDHIDFNTKVINAKSDQFSLQEKVVIKNKNGDVTYKVMTIKVYDNSGHNIGVMKVFNNVTREQMIDKLKSEFISIAAHQLRTPLSSIKWVIKMILSGDAGELNEEQADLLNKGYKSNERMITLVNDMLDVSRIEEGRFGYNFEVEDFMEILNTIVDTMQVQIEEKHLKFSIHKPDKVPFVEMDKKRMSLVIQNLLENAVKYTPEYGRIEVSIETEKDFLRIRIKDNGVGIPEEDRSKMFSKFFRANNVVRMQTEGSGLGLFIVKNIIIKHGGSIDFESEEGSGTEFILTIPYTHADDSTG